MQYELFYLVGGSKEAELDKIKAEVAGLVTSEGGVFEEKQVVEKRKMAYEVKHENRGFYVAQRFTMEEPEKIQAITRKLTLYTSILRSVVTRTDELPELTSRIEREAKKAEPRAEVKKSENKTVEPKPAEAKAERKKEAAPEEPKKEDKKKVDEEDIDKKS